MFSFVEQLCAHVNMSSFRGFLRKESILLQSLWQPNEKDFEFFRFGLRRGGFQVISISLKMLNCCALLTKVFGRHFCFSKRIIMSNLKLDKGNDSCSCFGVADGKFSAEIVMPYAPTLRAGFSFSRTPI